MPIEIDHTYSFECRGDHTDAKLTYRPEKDTLTILIECDGEYNKYEIVLKTLDVDMLADLIKTRGRMLDEMRK